MKNIPKLKGLDMKFPEFLEDYARKNLLKMVDIVEDNYQEKTSFFAIFEGQYGQEIKRIDADKEKVFES